VCLVGDGHPCLPQISDDRSYPDTESVNKDTIVCRILCLPNPVPQSRFPSEAKLSVKVYGQPLCAAQLATPATDLNSTGARQN